MKLFLLVIAILLLISRVKRTPVCLSKRLWLKDLQKNLDSYKSSQETKSESDIETSKAFAVAMVFVLALFMCIYYALIAGRFSEFPVVFVLSALQIVMTIIGATRPVPANGKAFSTDINDYKYHSIIFKANMVLDYVYYPIVIYLLLTI